jgi:hypothetical protein
VFVQTRGKAGDRMEIPCPNCSESFPVNPRPSNWTGKARVQIQCRHCQFIFRYGTCPKGAFRDQQRIELPTLNNGRAVALEEYDSTVGEATAFAETFRTAWQRIPVTATAVISAHWAAVHDTPHVWLLNDREEWNGQGWAATKDEGRSLYILSTVAAWIPPEHLQTFLAHECAHILCIATNEPAHVTPSAQSGHRLPQEWLVWQLMAAWGFDQLGAEVWMEQNTEETGETTRRRTSPLDGEALRQKIAKQHRDIEAHLVDKTIPRQLSAWLGDGSKR